MIIGKMAYMYQQKCFVEKSRIYYYICVTLPYCINWKENYIYIYIYWGGNLK